MSRLFLKYALLLFVSLSWAAHAEAQMEWVYAMDLKPEPETEATASIDGMVVDAATGDELPGANIALGNGKNGTSSGASGTFSLMELKPGTYTLTCTFVGYQRKEMRLQLKPGQKHQINIQLEPTAIMMDEVVIRSESTQKMTDIGMAHMDNEMIGRLPSAFESDLFRSLQFLPGIKSSSDFSSGLHIRGGSPDQTLILLDDTPVYNPSHFFGFYSTFNPDAIEGVNLYKGNYPASYGGRLGSVLQVENKSGGRDAFGGKFSMGMLASRLTAGSPYNDGKGNWMLSIRRSTLEPMLAALRGQADQIPEKFYFYDINAKVQHDINPENKLSVSMYSGRDRVQFPLTPASRLTMNYGNQMASGKWTHLYTNHLFSSTHVSYSGYINRPVNSVADTRQGLHNHIRDYGFSHKLHYLPGTGHQLETGLEGGLLELGFKNKLNDHNTFALNTSSTYASWYLQHQWDAGRHWTFTSGLRLNHFSSSQYLGVKPRLTVSYSPTSRLQFEAAYGQYDQFLSLTSNQMSGFNLWLSSGNKIKPATGDQFMLGMQTTPLPNIGFSVEAYYRTMENLFELDPLLPDMAGLPYHQLFRTGEGMAYGLEVMLEKQAGKMNGYVGYTWSNSYRKFPGINSNHYYPAAYNREHEFNVVLNYKISDSWQATATFNYATGQPYTEPVGHRRRTKGVPGYGNTVVFIMNEINGARLPAYHRMDIGFTKYGRFLDAADSKLSFQLVNAYSRRNTWHMQHHVYRGEISSSSATMLPVLPSVTYTINF